MPSSRQKQYPGTRSGSQSQSQSRSNTTSTASASTSTTNRTARRNQQQRLRVDTSLVASSRPSYSTSYDHSSRRHSHRERLPTAAPNLQSTKSHHRLHAPPPPNTNSAYYDSSYDSDYDYFEDQSQPLPCLGSLSDPAAFLAAVSDLKPSQPTGASPASLARQRSALRLPPSPSRHADESFLENPSPVDAAMADHFLPSGRPQRDSHDLSLSPRDVTRDSLVNNMLMSLDHFSMTQSPPSPNNQNQNKNKNQPYLGTSTYDDSPPREQHQQQRRQQQPDASRPWTNDSTASGRSYDEQHPYSSDLDDDSSRMSSRNSNARGRRSNSGSNFQGPSGRFNSAREAVPHSQAGASRGNHGRGGKHSNKSSSSASFDGGYVNPSSGGQHWTRSPGRSASFDYGPQPLQTQTQTPPRQKQQQQQQQQMSSPFRNNLNGHHNSHSSHSNHNNSFMADDFGAAPTPNIPGGPASRLAPSAMPNVPRPPPEPLNAPVLERKRSTSRSLKSLSGRGNTANSRHAAPAMPDPEMDSAPAPSVGYGKSKDPMHGGVSPATAAQAKEKPGFFRRVFGSSKSNAASNSASSGVQDVQNPPGYAPSPDRNTRPVSKMQQQHLQDVQSKAISAPPSRDTSSSHSHHHPVLQKKTSSFFRRRKKSFIDEPPPLPTAGQIPPVPPIAPINLHIERERSVAPAEPSPVSSLRQVMNPYLRNSATAGQSPTPLADITNTGAGDDESYERRGDYKREFSPDYEPSPNARIRTVQTEADHELSRADETPTRAPLEHPSHKFEDRNNSFLNLDGGSDNEDQPIAASKKKQSTKGVRNGTSKGSPTTRKTRGRDDTIRANKLPFAREHTDTDEDPGRSNLALPIEGARGRSPGSGSTETEYKSAPSGPPSVRVDGASDSSPKVLGTFETMKAKGLDEPEFVVGDPTADDRQKAQNIYDGTEDFIQKEKAAAWMGEEGPVRQRTLQAYMELYDFTEQSVLNALRKICGRLVFRAETQQVDRILVAFSKQWCDCNLNHGFKSTDVIHMLCYSIMLLNTDLHLADIEQKMTRSQFVKNTMTTITQAVAESAPDAFERRPSILPEKNSTLRTDVSRSSLEQDRKSFRSSFRPPPRPSTQASGHTDNIEDCGPLVKSPLNGPMRAWEEQMETVLKTIYASIRDERLPLFGAEPDRHLTTAQSQSSLSVIGMLKRSPSVLSKAPSEGQASMRGRIAENSRSTASRWASKSRSRPGFGRNGFSSSRTSFDDGNSIWSPAMSSATWSRYSLGRTQGSMSQDSFGSSMRRGDYQQSIGFANALSQAIIRDEDANGMETAPSILSAEIPPGQLLEDESLELSGPPWIKEGMVMHKHHLDGVDKRAKDRNWTEVFAVVQKGQMSLFSFTANKSARQKSRSRNPARPNGPVGGGNWQDNASNLGTFSLRLTHASALPPPGYSRTRPHVWALSLPTGAVHLFQVGTPDIIKEFVTTVNYWSARLSTHPLVGGISNVEYGWSEDIVNNSLVAAINESNASMASGRTSRASGHARKSSVQSGSFRSSSFDISSGPFTHSSGRGKLPGDRIHIAQWAPPTQSMRPSNAPEAEQLETLLTYVKSIEQDLQTHNQLRSSMLLAFTPRASNAGKAMSNWERKSAYLLRESVKFRTYVDCLKQADSRKREIYAERDLARRAARGELSDGDMEVSGEEGDETLRP